MPATSRTGRRFLAGPILTLALWVTVAAGASPPTARSPEGWIRIPGGNGTGCAPGTPFSFFHREGTDSRRPLVYFEGGGACWDWVSCSGLFDSSVEADELTDFSGIFDRENPRNPFRSFEIVFIPYCTGDVHFGTKQAGMVPALTTPQKFVGYFNMKTYIGRIVPTYKDRVSKVVIAGSSAGGFGAALNFSMVQDAFGDIPVTVLDDSGPPFDDQYMPVCMQKRWRDAWGLNDAMPPDCEECFQADGGGMLHLTDFLERKHPNAKIGLISSMQDEVIRLFYSVGLQDCANYDTADPVAVVLLQIDPNSYFPAQQYTDGLNALRSTYMPTGRMASYFMGGVNITYHQHLFRDRFYDSTAGSETIAQFATNLINGQVDTVGP